MQIFCGEKEKPMDKIRCSDLMTLADIAEMHHCTQRHARDVIVKLPGFPEEAPTSTPRKRLWVRSEIRAFIHRDPTRSK